MGFRDPITTASAVDTGNGGVAGVRLYQDVSNPAVPAGVAEWRTGYMSRNATVRLTGGLSGGSSYAVSGGRYQGIDAPELDLNVESLPGGGYGPVARIHGATLVVDGIDGLAYARLVATGNAPATGTYAAGQWVTVPFGAAPLDSHGGFGAPGSTKWTVPVGQGGIYDVNGQIVYTGDAGNPVHNARLLINGLVFPGCAGAGAQLGTSAGVSSVTSVKAVSLKDGDRVEVQGYSSNAWVTTTFSDAASNLEIIRVR